MTMQQVIQFFDGVTLDSIWKMAAIAASIATSVSAVVALFSYMSNSKANRISNQKEAQLFKEAQRIDAWKEINSLVSKINDTPILLDPAGSRTNKFYISKFINEETL